MTSTANGHHVDPKDGRQSNEKRPNGRSFEEHQRRDVLLCGVAEAARRLLAIADFDAAVNEALEAIGTAAGIDRIFVYQHHVELQTCREFADCPYEWTVPGIVRSCDLPGQFPMFYDEIPGYIDWVSELKAGRAVQKLAKDMSVAGQEKQIQEQALSVLTVPIFIRGSYWGNFGFDDCTTERVWSEAEIAVLETAAVSFAGALRRRGDVAELERRDALLNSVNAAAQCLVATDDLERAIPEALQILGEGTRQDRVYVFENVFPKGPGEVFGETPFEWVKKGVPTSSEIATSAWPLPMASFPSELMNPFFEGQAVQFLTRDLEGSARAINEEGQTLSLVAVPIAVSGRWWGVLGFDDCTTERVWSDAEIAVLQTAAACIGSAIERDRTRKDREAAARARAQELETHNRVLARRDRILQATATASNVLLNGEDFDASVSEALESLGESLGFDRIAVGQQFGDPTGKTSGFIRFLYEWDAPGISAQLQDYEDMADFHWDEMGLGSWYEASLRGEAFGQLIDELPKPFRGLMESVDVKSTHNVPIFVEGQFWGVFGIDHCSEKRLLTQSELIALKTAANCVGGAIERDLTRKEREAAVQTRAAEVETHNQALAERDRILEATAAAANVMLTEENFDRAVNDALQIIGAGLEVDRVLLGQYLEPSSEWKFCYIQFLYEWASPNTSLQLEHPELSRIGNGGIEEIIDCLRAGEVFGGIVEELPEPFRSGQQELGAQSVYAVPVVVNSRFWGIVALDDCHQKTRRSDAELEALRTLANCIGSAIEREQLRQAELQSRAAREVAERTALIERERAARATELEAANAVLTTRDRWLETTAAAANQLLSSDDVATSVNVALATIGENLECDRVTVLEYIRNPDASPDDLGLMRLLYEWDAEGIAAQMDAPELHDIPADGIEDWFREILKGQYVGGVVAELDEPFRSGQQKLGVQSTYGVPVFVEETLWGLVAMDHCREARRLSAAELAVFRTAATCVGSAIYQARVQRDRAARERARLLGSVAEVANLLLQSADYTTVLPEVVRLLGEAVRSDRCAVTQDVIHPDSGHLAVKFLHEWCAAGRESTATCVPEFLDEGQHLRLDGSFLEFHQSLLRGEVVNFLVADLSAPER
ncbi:MAG: GAF domain-containing protein, partial [Cyanobacteria bacterium P01_E01_bin.45]